MVGTLGEKLGEGAMSDVHAWAPEQVVKLFKAGVPGRIAGWEARMTRAVFAAGGPAPEVLDEVKIDGRRGIVLPRLDGPTLMEQVLADAVSIPEAGAILAALARSTHETRAIPELLPVRDYMDSALRLAEATIPPSIATGVLALIDRLPKDDRLSHGDLHPGNVILTAEGPRLIDWTGAKQGGAPLDLATCLFHRTELVVERHGPPEQRLALGEAMQAEYARLAGVDPHMLRAEIDAHLPVARVFFLLSGVAKPATRERLLQRLAADFGG